MIHDPYAHYVMLMRRLLGYIIVLGALAGGIWLVGRVAAWVV